MELTFMQSFGKISKKKKIKMRRHTQDDDLVNLQLFPDRRKADQNISPANPIHTHIHMRFTVLYLHKSCSLSSWLYKLLGNCSLLKCVQAFREGAIVKEHLFNTSGN
jgi:hypothetical protein